MYTDFDAYGTDAHGVYRHVTGTLRGGHAVLVVGYSDVDNCWICRNSWGQGFGGAAKPEGVGAGFFKIGYGECDIDGEPFYGARGVIAPADSRWVAGGRWRAELLPRAHLFLAFPAVRTSWISSASGPTTERTLPPGSPASRAGTACGVFRAVWQLRTRPLLAVSRSTDKLDIFSVGTDYHVYTAAWEAGDTSWRGWWPVLGGVAAPGTSVFGVFPRSRQAGHILRGD